MSFILESPSERFDLGDPLDVFAALADAVRAADGVEYPALWGLVHTNEEPISDEYLGTVRRQAAELLERAGDDLTTRARWLLNELVRTDGESRPEPPWPDRVIKPR